MLLSGCLNGQTGSSLKVSSDFLLCVKDEYVNNNHGICTKEVVKDWIGQNDG